MNTLALLAIDAYDGSVVATSLTLVFSMLVLLNLIIVLEGKIFDARDARKKAAALEAAANNTQTPAPARAPAPAPARAPAPAPARAPAPAPAPAPETGIPAEAVAAIAAAVACCEGENATVRSIRRAPGAAGRRGVWGDAGVLQATRPFV